MARGFDNPSFLQVTTNRWDRTTVSAVDPDSPEIVDRKVKGLLTKEQEEAAAAADATATVTPEEPVSKSSEEECEVQEVSTEPTVEKEESEDSPFDLSSAVKSNIPAAVPSALATARIIDDLSRVPYPKNIQSPKVELNINAKNGKYDRDFLLQFMSICKEKPDMLLPLDALGIGPVDQASMSRTIFRGGTHLPERTQSITNPPGTGNVRGFPGFGAKVAAPFSGMGKFGAGPKSSQQRFELVSGARVPSGTSAGSAFGRPSPMTRTTSPPGVGSQLGSKRTRSKRGETRDKPNSGSQLAYGSD
ncbi:hypothetical protein DFH09DRAFT_1477216 [Mycena vulgaris]|nr:hypothetical protein DFH09DRAFT_1477216 [Mycena vulgaris]